MNRPVPPNLWLKSFIVSVILAGALILLSVLMSADFVYLLSRTGLTWGNLSSHMSKLEQAGYIEVRKDFKDKRPHTMLAQTDMRRIAFDTYRQNMIQLLGQNHGD